MQLSANLAPQARCLVVIGGGGFERGVGVTHKHLVFIQFWQTLEPDPVMSENGAVVDGVVHHLLVPGTEADKIGVLLCLFLSPLFSPYRVPVAVDGLDPGDMHPLCIA